MAPAEDGGIFVSLWSLGYQDDPRGVHTHKIVRWSSEDPSMDVDLIDDRGRRWHVESLVPGQDILAMAQCQEWLAYQAVHAERLAVIDAAARQLQVDKMETWPE